MTFGMAERIRKCAELAGSGDALSRKTAIPRRTLETYLTGATEPKASRLVAIARAADVTVEWLATGEGPMREGGEASAAAPASAGIDRSLLAAVHKGVAEAHGAGGAAMSAESLADEVARIYDDLVAAYDTPDERRSGLKLALHQLRRDLRVS